MVPGNDIVTVSLGASRECVSRESVCHGQVYVMSHQRPTSPSPRRESMQAKPIKVLSDSKNRSIDCSLFKDLVIAFRKDLFHICNIKDHIPDVVLISVIVM